MRTEWYALRNGGAITRAASGRLTFLRKGDHICRTWRMALGFAQFSNRLREWLEPSIERNVVLAGTRAQLEGRWARRRTPAAVV